MARYSPDGLEWYDALFRFQGRWIDNRGAEMFIKARYVAWGIGIFATAFWFIFARTIGADVLLSVFYSVLLGAGTAKLGADYLTSEHTLLSWVQIGFYGVRRLIRRRRRARQLARLRAPRTVIGAPPARRLHPAIARHVCKVLPVAGYAPPARKAAS